MRLELKARQNLIISSAMQQAFLVLQLPALELAEWLKIQIEQNPMLEYEEIRGEPEIFLETEELDFEKQNFDVIDDLDECFTNAVFPDTEKGPCDEICTPPSLSEHLMQQAHEVFNSREQLAKAEEIIGSLDQRGYLEDSVVDEEILKIIQTFDPPGIAARDLQECLLIQLRQKGMQESAAYKIVEHRFQDLIHNRIHTKEMNEIAALDFHPGHRFSSFASPSLIPDIIVQNIGGEWQIEINEIHLPQFSIAHPPLHTLDEKEKTFVRRHIAQGKWLIRTLRRRQQTLKTITEFLLKKQTAFFQENPKLIPLTMQNVADELGLHESTVARAVGQKYIATPQGIHSLRSFFTSSLSTLSGKRISNRAVKDKISQLVQGEDKHNPLSDNDLSSHLSKQGISCARRTIAKYRRHLRLPPSSHRKKWY